MKTYRWGIVGTGKMSRTFCQALSKSENAEIAAICSRSMERAEAFSKDFGIPAAYDNVAEMAHDGNVDIIYIATTNVNHADAAITAIDGGKAVLCEKPAAINSKQVEAVIAYAKKKNVFYMEAMWTAFLPALLKVKKWIDDDVIGKVKEVKASFFHKMKYDKSNRTIDIAQGGGSLLDLGVYPIFLAQMVLGGRPVEIKSYVNRCENGIDWQSSAVMKFYNGETAYISCGFEYNSNHAEITGTNGTIVIPDFNCASSAYVIKNGGIADAYRDSLTREQKYACEIAHVSECLEKGLTESPVYQTWQTYDILNTCDRLRKEWGLSYPNESCMPSVNTYTSKSHQINSDVKSVLEAEKNQTAEHAFTPPAPSQLDTETPKAVRMSNAIDWFRDAAFYHIYPLGFCGENRYNDFNSQPTGKIKSVIPYINHLERLGANAVYFGPVFESTRHGYDTADYRIIDRRLGTNDDFAEVTSELHKHGIKVVLDGVFNHVGRDFWAFNDVKSHRWDSPYKDWFNINFNGNSNYNDGFWYEGWEGHYDLVKLNLKNPAVKGHIFSCIEGWVNEFGIDGLRLDVAYCLDRDFLSELHSFCKGKWPDFFLLGECLHGDYNTWCNDSMLDSVTNYECYKGLYSSFNCSNMHEIGYSLNRQFGDDNWTIYRGKSLYCFVDNHDVTRIASILTDKSNLNLVYAMLFAMPGIPSVYYGSEFGMSGEKSHGDDALRPSMSAEQADVSFNEISEYISKLYNVRTSTPALCRGNYKQLHINSKQLIFSREFNGERVIFALNMDNAPYTAHFNAEAGRAKDMISGQMLDFGGGLIIPAKTVYIAKVM